MKVFPLAAALSSPVLYAVGMAEKGSPCARRLGVATETTGVVRVWVACAPAASRWAFCRRGRQHVNRGRLPGEPRSEDFHAGNDDGFAVTFTPSGSQDAVMHHNRVLVWMEHAWENYIKGNRAAVLT